MSLLPFPNCCADHSGFKMQQRGFKLKLGQYCHFSVIKIIVSGRFNRNYHQSLCSKKGPLCSNKKKGESRYVALYCVKKEDDSDYTAHLRVSSVTRKCGFKTKPAGAIGMGEVTRNTGLPWSKTCNFQLFDCRLTEEDAEGSSQCVYVLMYECGAVRSWKTSWCSVRRRGLYEKGHTNLKQ